MNNIIKKAAFIIGVFMSASGYAAVLPGLFDSKGAPVHTADEFTLQITVAVTKVSQGYQYNYSLRSSPSSSQSVWGFDVKLPAVDGVVRNSTSSLWGSAGYPNDADSIRDKYFGAMTYTDDELFVSWATYPDKNNPQLLVPSGTLSGFTFMSPYPPGMHFGYAEGLTPAPAFTGEPSSEEASLPFHKHTPYGPGKVFPVIGPVKPASPNVTDNYSVIGCTGGLCDVQLDITGPMDPYGTTYTYTWTGPFGTAAGAKPVVRLAPGNYTVSVSVSDPYATLVTATMPVTVVDPNPPVINPPGGGNQGGGQTGGGNGNGGAGQGDTPGDMDHDGIDDAHDDDRDGDGKSNDHDPDPDHPD